MLEKEINDHNHYTQKLNTLVAEQETIINQKSQYLDDNQKITIDINNVSNLLYLLVNINWSGIFASTTDLVRLFNKNFAELLQKKWISNWLFIFINRNIQKTINNYYW